MKKLFTLFMLLGIFSAPAFGQDAEGQDPNTPTAASFCNDDRGSEDEVTKNTSTNTSGSKDNTVENAD